MINKVTDIDAYNMAYEFCMQVFSLTKSFPKEEKYSLTDHFAKDCGYITIEKHEELTTNLNNIAGKIFKLFQNWKSF